MLIAGAHDASGGANGLASNWVHFGASIDGRWSHYRQNKHHRWSLDRNQIEQYQLTNVLDPRVRWWEGIEVPNRSLQVMERDDGPAIASLVCEDLAQIDDVLGLLRTVGPTLIVALLLDGPQLTSRWAARYATVLGDDSGSAVLTLTSSGMVANAQRVDQKPSTVVGLWKESGGSPHEISLEPGAEAVLLRLERGHAVRRAVDGRSPKYDASDLRLGDILQLHSAKAAALLSRSRALP
jgi:hypothetical protein